MGDISDNFWKSERVCKCGRHPVPYDIENLELLGMLEVARSMFGRPIIIRSWVRCPLHNVNEGGKENSAHLTGHAVDITVYRSDTRYVLEEALQKAGFTRFGEGKTFLHADCDKTKPEKVRWTY
uniref:Putative peptidase n=2 Tax=viral metagenome TaxID=1070528 RepID=A0A6M3IE72_9ZZZZ